jgi:hypothetical protein
MKTSDVPHLKEQSMATTSGDKPAGHTDATAAEAATANPGEKRSVGTTRKPAARDLAPAAESTDPAVHQLMAEVDILRQNGDDDAVQAKLADLAELGYR